MKNLPLGRLVAEFLVIVVGVLVALGADAWWGGQQDRRAGEESLRSLLSDFRATEADFRLNLTNTETQEGHIRAFMQTLESDRGSVPLDSLSGMVRPAFVWYRFEPVMTTYRDLLGAGDLDLIRNDRIRSSLAEFDTYMEEARPFLDGHQALWQNEIVPYLSTHFNVPDLYGSHRSFVDEGGDNPGIEMGSLARRVESNEAAFWSREFLNLLAFQLVHLDDTTWFIEPALDRTASIIELIESELSP